MSNDDAIKAMVESFKRNEEARKRYQRQRDNPWLPEVKIARFVMFLMVTGLVGSFFMGLLYLAYLVEGGWLWWFKYYCYGLGSAIGYKLSKHESMYP